MKPDAALDLAKACATRMYASDRASQALGIKVEIVRPGVARAHMRVRDDMLNGQAICHGGLIFALADTAFAFACNSYNRVTVAAAASIDFLHPARLGDELIALAEEAHRGGRSGLYDVQVNTADGLAIAIFRGRSASTAQVMLEDAPAAVAPGPDRSNCDTEFIEK